jgi:beta-glucosidase
MDAYRFPEGFEWGVATSAFQIEGGERLDGRGPSVWDVFARAPARGIDPASDVTACDHVHRWAEDIALMRALGVQHYRFSISWPRVFPEGEGACAEAGAAFYDRLIDALLEAGITPAMTLYHWELPQALEDRYGGWRSRETAKRFGDLAAWAGRRYGDRVRRFITTNEFFCFTDRGYGNGEFAPGVAGGPAVRNQARHHGLLGHGYAVQALRACGRGLRIGIAEDARTFVPIVETPEHVAAARRAFRSANAHFLTAIMEGAYPAEYMAAEGPNAPPVHEGDFAAIGAPLDFVGLNLYTGGFVEAADTPAGFADVPLPPAYPRMHVPWIRPLPAVSYWAPRFCHELWGVRSICITENGCGCDDRLDERGRVMDVDRIFYLREHLMQAHRATAEGIPLHGIYVWSLLDNYEWLDGLRTRFGLVHVDFATQQRRPKLSARFYAETMRRNRVV